MASDIFAKLGDIKGESTDDKHRDEIEVLSFSFGFSNFLSASAGSGAATGRATFHDLSFTHKIDKASPVLMQSCATGVHIPTATISVRKSGQSQDYLTYDLTDVIITSAQIGGNPGGDGPVEQISLNYAKVKVGYRPQSPNGSLGELVESVLARRDILTSIG